MSSSRSQRYILQLLWDMKSSHFYCNAFLGWCPRFFTTNLQHQLSSMPQSMCYNPISVAAVMRPGHECKHPSSKHDNFSNMTSPWPAAFWSGTKHHNFHHMANWSKKLSRHWSMEEKELGTGMERAQVCTRN